MKSLGYGLFFIFIHCVISNLCHADFGIITALNSNMTRLKKGLEITRISKEAKREYYAGKFFGKSVVLVRSPMGKINNAITTQALLSNFPIDMVISLSPCGALGNGISMGDIVIAKKIYQHDFGTIKPYGFIWSKVPDGTGRNDIGYNTPCPSLLNICVKLAGKMKSQNTVVPGIIVSGDQFISARSKKEWLIKKFKADAVDMGSGAIAQVCFANTIPFCILRVATDNAEVAARSNFEQSVLNNQSDIDILQLIKGILHEYEEKKN